MPDYVIDRGNPYIDRISEQRASEIYAAAQPDPDAELDGTLEGGFTYLIGEPGEPHLVRATVRPVKAD
jgi:hypothetical protein